MDEYPAMEQPPVWLGHRERVRWRVDTSNEEDMRLVDLMELILYYAEPRSDVHDAAQALADDANSIRKIFRSSREELMEIPGINRRMANWVMMTSHMVHLYESAVEQDQPAIISQRQVMPMAMRARSEVRAPQYRAVYTDFDHCFITRTVLANSAHWAEPEYTTRIVAEAMELRAKHVFLMLFTGVEYIELEPWEIDYMTDVACTLKAIGVELSDFLIISEMQIVSLKERGVIDDIRELLRKRELTDHLACVREETEDMNRIARFYKVSRNRFEADLREVMPGVPAPWEDIRLPRRATGGSAGYDFFAPVGFRLEPGESFRMPTGVRARIEAGWALMIFPRSSLGFKYRLMLSNTVGVVDSDYFGAGNEGHILIKFTNAGDQPIEVEAGTAVAQGVFLPHGLTEDDDASDPRVGGFGSTDILC